MRHLLAAMLIAVSAPILTACETLDSPGLVGRDAAAQAAGGIVRQYARTWNARDMTGFGALYAADARYVNSAGTFIRGRSAIVSTHTTARTRYPETARMSTSLRAARPITDDTIVAIMGMDIRDGAKPQPIHATRLTLTLVRREGAWVIAQAQATQPASAEVGAPPQKTAGRTK